MGLIPCPKCAASKTTVLQTQGLRRRRVCSVCGERFTTLEIVVKAGQTPEILTRQIEILRRKREAMRSRMYRKRTGNRSETRRLARQEAAETGEAVEAIYERWGVT